MQINLVDYLIYKINTMAVIAPLKALVVVIYIVAIKSDCDVVPRNDWGAREPTKTETLNAIPPHYLVIHHSATSSCNDSTTCKNLLKSIQNYHMDHNGWWDIAYNFLIGGDGVVYEGRGYTTMGSHCVPFNRRSLGVCLLGTFTDNLPNDKQMKALKNFINCLEERDHLADDYHLLGHRQASATLCPGNALYDEIETWPHFDPNPKRS